ncbi:MAG: hypothetical protein AAGA91_17290, partial [Pseudomonadota bacterium]
MSHLLYLIFRNISHTSAHTSVFINLLNSFNYRSGSEKRPGNDPTEDAYYTHRESHRNQNIGCIAIVD